MHESQKKAGQAYAEIERKIINLMLRFPDVVGEMLSNGITPLFFDHKHRHLVSSIFQQHAFSNGKRSLTDDHYRTLLLGQGVKGDITIAMQVYHDCMYGVSVNNAKDDFDLLKKELINAYVHRSGVEALHRMNETVPKIGYIEATRQYAVELEFIVNTASPAQRVNVVQLKDLAAEEAMRKWIWYNILAKGNVTLFSAKRKKGKTTFLSEFLKHTESGGQFVGEIVPCRVLYITEETRTNWRIRCETMGIDIEKEHIHLIFALEEQMLCPTLPQFSAFWRKTIHTFVKDNNIDCVVFDTIGKLFPIKDERDTGQWFEAFKPILEETSALQIATLLVHHNRKSKDGGDAIDFVRGSSVITDSVDQIVVMDEPLVGAAGDRTLTLSGRLSDFLQVEVGFDVKNCQYFVHSFSELKDDNQTIRAVEKVLTKNAQTAREIADAIEGCSFRNVTRALLKGTELGFWIRVGKGIKGNPHTYSVKSKNEAFIQPLKIAQ